MYQITIQLEKVSLDGDDIVVSDISPQNTVVSSETRKDLLDTYHEMLEACIGIVESM